MLRTFVHVNGHVFDFFDYKEALSYVMSIAIRHSQYAPLITLKENICEACDQASELLTILTEQAVEKQEKSNLKRKATKMIKSKEFFMKMREKDPLLLSWGEMMMSIEGKGLLHGYGFTNAHGDHIRGNSEKTSVTKVDQ